MKIPTPPKPVKFTHATYIPARRPAWKYHTNLGKAKNALSYMSRECTIFEIAEDGELKQLYYTDGSWGKLSRKDQVMPWESEFTVKRDRIKSDIRVKKMYIDQKQSQIDKLKDEIFALEHELYILEKEERERFDNDLIP